ncbi:MAG TPA: SDR family NAD(P)-dependent oxidoreductase [Candidatus Binatia bacterium]|jgi:NAD(P)-dependent dehydrogenase (short-subunit alcohol dehydrogenase family)|nr:SDR family NAD(P)-dependent oxidoreductase [Candidatus Binatia bacterium]
MNEEQPMLVDRPLEPRPRAIVVGASSGIGAALVLELVSHGYMVAALARRKEQLQQVCDEANRRAKSGCALAYVHDVTRYESVEPLFQDIVRDLGGLDAIVYVAGVQPAVGPTEFNFEKDAAMVEVNLLGAMAWLDQAAIRFQQTRSGIIVGVSSISGDRGRAAFPGYHASKGALSIFLESLRNRLSLRGVSVTTIKPGFVDTSLLENAQKTMWVISPREAAAQIRIAFETGKQVVYVPARWRWVMLVIRHIPSFLFRRLNL